MLSDRTVHKCNNYSNTNHTEKKKYSEKKYFGNISELTY
jgi:hypothetical protein